MNKNYANPKTLYIGGVIFVIIGLIYALVLEKFIVGIYILFLAVLWIGYGISAARKQRKNKEEKDDD